MPCAIVTIAGDMRSTPAFAELMLLNHAVGFAGGGGDLAEVVFYCRGNKNCKMAH